MRKGAKFTTIPSIGLGLVFLFSIYLQNSHANGNPQWNRVEWVDHLTGVQWHPTAFDKKVLVKGTYFDARELCGRRNQRLPWRHEAENFLNAFRNRSGYFMYDALPNLYYRVRLESGRIGHAGTFWTGEDYSEYPGISAWQYTTVAGGGMGIWDMHVGEGLVRCVSDPLRIDL